MQDSQQTMTPYVQQIQGLAQKVQQAHQSQQEAAAMADPTAQAIIKTQMAETQRKTAETQATMQIELKKAQQDYDLRIAELQRQVQELVTKYQTQTSIDNQRNAKDIAMANINNSARERVAMIQAGSQMTQQQAQMEHEQNISAIEATQAAEEDLRQHGLAVQQQAFDQEAEKTQKQMELQQSQQEHAQGLAQADQQHQQQLAQTGQQNAQQMAQSDQQHQQAMQQQAEQQAAQPQPTPPQGQA